MQKHSMESMARSAQSANIEPLVLNLYLVLYGMRLPFLFDSHPTNQQQHLSPHDTNNTHIYSHVTQTSHCLLCHLLF